MISTNQFKNGNHIDVEGTIFKIVDFQHVKPGKGGAFVRTKLKRSSDGAAIDSNSNKNNAVRIEVRLRHVQRAHPSGPSAGWRIASSA